MSGAGTKTVSLVLGSGGARGLAHIGIIRWLEENDFEIKSIAGCSIGALIGGIYAADRLHDFEMWVRAVSKVDIVTLLDLSWSKDGLVKGDKIINTLVELVGDRMIEDLPIPYTAVAADIQGEKEIWIQSGLLFDAIRASISLPMFFTPFEYRGMDLIDGGVLNPVPIAPTFGDHTDLTIAVNLGGSAVAPTNAAPESKPDESSGELQDAVLRFIGKLKLGAAGDGHRDWDAYDIANQAFDAMQGTIARLKLAAYPPDHVIEIPRNACGTLEFDRADEMIQLGYDTAKRRLEQSA